jgi:hypothetical protein
MPTALGYALASLAAVVGVAGTLMLVVLLLAGGANGTPELLRQFKVYMVLSGFGGGVCLAGAIVLMVNGRFAWASLLGALPMVFLLGMTVWVSLR